MKGRKPEIQTDTDAVAVAVRAPAWLSKDAKAEWRRIMPRLVERRILTDADMGSVENYCVAIGQVREMQRTLDKDGYVVETARGPRQHPAYRMLADAMTRARLLAAELGLTPVSRSRPAMCSNSVDDDASDLGV